MSENGNNSSGHAGRSLADELFEMGLREIIERHNPSIISDYQFFWKACSNSLANEEIIGYLLERFPAAVNTISRKRGLSPLHCACLDKRVTLNIVQLLNDAAPDLVRSVNNKGQIPLHHLCYNRELDEKTAIEILHLLVEKCPESVRHADNDGRLPLHEASLTRSPEFCRSNLATVEYLYNIHPDAIEAATEDGLYPIHCAIQRLFQKGNATSVLDIVQFLLDSDPNVKLQKFEGESLLYLACEWDYNDSNIEAAIEVIKALYDAYPEAIEDNELISELDDYHQQVQIFITEELSCARLARNHRLLSSPDENGQLPLHLTLQCNVRLGSTKLLVKGNPSATRSPDNNAALPLHVACQHHESPRVIQYLIDLDPTTLNAIDGDGNTALHHACVGAKHDTVALLLETYDAVSVSNRNAQEKLPIDLLWESDKVEDRGSVEYLGSVFRLLRAYPEILMSIQNQNAKKRKLVDA